VSDRAHKYNRKVRWPTSVTRKQKDHNANKSHGTQTKVTARKQKLTARKQKLTARKKKLTAPKKKLTAPTRKNSRHQRKTHGTKEKTHGTKEKLAAQEHIFSMRGLETDLKQSNKHGGLNKIYMRLNRGMHICPTPS
jgi:hypothetical protein